jgi:hypothetical protein
VQLTFASIHCAAYACYETPREIPPSILRQLGFLFTKADSRCKQPSNSAPRATIPTTEAERHCHAGSAQFVGVFALDQRT